MTASRRIIDLLVSEKIGTLIIGYNQEWKQEVKLGKRNNQHIVSIPFARFIHMLTYKAELAEIHVVNWHVTTQDARIKLKRLYPILERQCEGA